MDSESAIVKSKNDTRGRDIRLSCGDTERLHLSTHPLRITLRKGIKLRMTFHRFRPNRSTSFPPTKLRTLINPEARKESQLKKSISSIRTRWVNSRTLASKNIPINGDLVGLWVFFDCLSHCYSSPFFADSRALELSRSRLRSYFHNLRINDHILSPAPTSPSQIILWARHKLHRQELHSRRHYSHYFYHQ